MMWSLIALLVTIGFYLWYTTTSRIKVNTTIGIEPWSQARPRLSKFIGGLAFTVACILAIVSLGVGAGVFVFSIVLMTVGSLLILLVPLEKWYLPTLLVILSISMLIEFLL